MKIAVAGGQAFERDINCATREVRRRAGTQIIYKEFPTYCSTLLRSFGQSQSPCSRRSASSWGGMDGHGISIRPELRHTA